MVLNYNYIPSTKHGTRHKRNYLHGIGVQMIDFCSFGEDSRKHLKDIGL